MKNSLVNHYYLFKKINKNTFEFILEDICFNKVFSYKEISQIKFKDAGLAISTELSKTNYDRFYLKCLEFEKAEEIDESIENEYKIVEVFEQEITQKEAYIPEELRAILSKYDYSLEGDLIYFRSYEEFPLAMVGPGYIKIKKNRYLNDVSLSNQLSFKNLEKIIKTLKELLENQPSSRLLSFEKLVNRLIKIDYDESDLDQSVLVDEVDASYEQMLDSDKLYPDKYLESIYNSFVNWKPTPAEPINESKVEKVPPSDSDVYITEHASLRINERIGEMTLEEQLDLARLAYEYGEHSGHYIEKDPEMFKFLQYIQNKHPGKTLRLYKGIIFIFGMKPPHGLVTVYPFYTSYERYQQHQRPRT